MHPLQICRIVHATNIALQAVDGDEMPSEPWDSWPRQATTLAGVLRVLNGLTAKENHENWVAEMTARGWQLGAKDPDKKLHPCLVPWEELPAAYRRRARVFEALVNELSQEGGE